MAGHQHACEPLRVSVPSNKIGLFHVTCCNGPVLTRLRCGGHTSNRPEGASADKPERLSIPRKGSKPGSGGTLTAEFELPRKQLAFARPQLTRAKALRIKPPRTSALTAGFCERLTGHLSVRREGHFEFNATECGSGEGLAVEECRLDVAWSHGLRSEGCARVEKYCRNKEWFCAHRTPGG